MTERCDDSVDRVTVISQQGILFNLFLQFNTSNIDSYISNTSCTASSTAKISLPLATDKLVPHFHSRPGGSPQHGFFQLYNGPSGPL